MSDLIFEHPLNEKCRNYLRFESLFLQLARSRPLTELWHHQLLFKAIFDLTEISDRSDLKPDLIKDLEKQKQQLEYWSKLPGVDLERVNQLHHSVSLAIRHLVKLPKLGSSVKEDKFLSSIRQRFILPGGTCCFDLPNLHWWLHQDREKMLQDVDRWLREWDLAANALALLLNLLRERGEFAPQTANSGFYQGVAEGCELLRITLPGNTGYYPTISGHKHRFAIRFMPAENSDSEPVNIPFYLATCTL